MNLTVIPYITKEDNNVTIILYYLTTAQDMYLFNDIIYEHSEYTTEWEQFRSELNDIDTDYMLVNTRTYSGKDGSMIGRVEIYCNLDVSDKITEYIRAQEYTVNSDGMLVSVKSNSF